MNIEEFKFPSNWKVGSIADAFDFTGKPRGLDLSKNGDEIPFFPMNRIPLGRIHVSEFTPKPLAKLGSGTYVEKGDLMVAKITPSFENGKQAIVDIETDFAYATTEVIPMRGRKGESDTLFLFFYLLHPEVRSDLAGKMEGSTGRQRLSKTVIGDRIIPLPPLPEQKKIAHILSTVQRAIEAQERIIQTTTELFKSMLHQLMTAQISVSKGDRIEEGAGGGRGMSWNETEIPVVDSEHFETLNGLWKGKKEPFVEAGVIRNTNFTPSGVIDYSNVAYLDVEAKKFSKRRLEPGDIILERSGGGPKQPVGRVVFFDREDGDFSFSNFTSAVRVKDKATFDPRFVFYRLMELYQSGQTEDIQRRTTGIRNLDFTAYKERARFPRIPLPEQKKIAHILSTIQQKVDNAQSKKSKLQDIFRTLLHELMTAKIRVHK